MIRFSEEEIQTVRDKKWRQLITLSVDAPDTEVDAPATEIARLKKQIAELWESALKGVIWI